MDVTDCQLPFLSRNCEIFDEKKTDGRILRGSKKNVLFNFFVKLNKGLEDVEIVYGNDGFFLILNSLLSVLK